MDPFEEMHAISCSFRLKTMSRTLWALSHSFVASALMKEYEGTGSAASTSVLLSEDLLRWMDEEVDG
jgi:hypothetical protein